MQLIPITINNRLFQVRANASVLQACEEASIEVPRFCYHEKLSVAGNCRMCLVEVEKSPKPVVSCAMPVSKNMVIYTNTPLVRKAREAVLEFLLINHPLDCPICDQAGECDLQDETLQYASDRGRFFEFKRSVEDKECGPIIKTIMTRCIHCTRCIRFSAEIAGQEVLGAFGRGTDTEIGTYVQSFIKTELSGNLVDLCPVGALTSKPYAFTSRSWELQKNDTIDFFDGMCADITVQTKNVTAPVFLKGKAENISREDIVRILPRQNGYYSDNWISDKTRYAFDGLKTQRLRNVFANNRAGNDTTWSKVFVDFLFQNMQNMITLSENSTIKPFKTAVIVESNCDVESIYALTQFSKILGSTDFQEGNTLSTLSYNIPSFYLLNHAVEDLNIIKGLLLIGTNPRFEASILNTYLRKYQVQKGLSYVSIGAASDLKMKNTQEGNSLRSLILFILNKMSNTQKFAIKGDTFIFVGADNFKNKNSFALQNITRLLGKKTFAKTKTKERLGILHSNTTSLVFANLGLKPGVRSVLYNTDLKDKEIGTLFAVQPHKISSKKWISAARYTNVVTFATHNSNKISSDVVLPLKSLYEKDGLLFNVEGRLRKFYKSVTAPKNVNSIEAFVMLALKAYSFETSIILNNFWSLYDEVPVERIIEQSTKTFDFNIYSFEENACNIKLCPFVPSIMDFYMSDLITQNSKVMGECNLFLNSQSSFK